MASKSFHNQPFLPGLVRNTVARAHGGELALGRRKVARPFDSKQALHVVLRSSKARGAYSLLHPHHCNLIRDTAERLRVRWGIRVFRYANVGNHLHLLIQAPTRAAWQGFIRELSGRIAMIVTGARKGNGLARSGSRKHGAKGIAESAQRGFWDHLVFTRIVAWGRDYKNVAQYVAKNLWEGAGVSVRKYLKRGFRVLELSEDGIVMVRGAAAHCC